MDDEGLERHIATMNPHLSREAIREILKRGHYEGWESKIDEDKLEARHELEICN